jgi:phosphatidylglycerol:prolipoprotein diacylglycerol transferase
MFPVLQIGPLAVQVPGLVLILGLWMGLNLAERYARLRGVEPNSLYSLVFAALIAGIIGARLAYAARYPQAFALSPTSLLSINPGLLDPIGGVAVGIIAGIIYGQRKKLPLLPTLDALVPLLAVMALASGLAHLASGAAFGIESQVPWAIQLWEARRHPTQIYEILAAAILLALFWPGRSIFQRLQPGMYFMAFCACSAASALFLGAFRADSTLISYGIRSGQLAAWIILAISLIALGRLIKERNDNA